MVLGQQAIRLAHNCLYLTLFSILLSCVGLSEEQNTYAPENRQQDCITEEASSLAEPLVLFQQLAEAAETENYQSVRQLLIESYQMYPENEIDRAYSHLRNSALEMLPQDEAFEIASFLDSRFSSRATGPQFYLFLGTIEYREGLFSQSRRHFLSYFFLAPPAVQETYAEAAVLSLTEAVTEQINPTLLQIVTQNPQVLDNQRIRGRIQRYLFQEGVFSSSEESLQYSILDADGSDLWYGTWNGEIGRIDTSSNSTRVFVHGQDTIDVQSVEDICVTNTHVYIAQYRNVFSYNKSSGSFHILPNTSVSSPNRIRSIEYTPSGLFAGTADNGLWLYQQGAWIPVLASRRDIRSIDALCLFNQELLFIGTQGRGSYTLDISSLSLTNLGRADITLPNIHVSDYYIDPDRTVWISTVGHGIYYNEVGNQNIEQIQLGSDGQQDIVSIIRGIDYTFAATMDAGILVIGSDRQLHAQMGLNSGLPGLQISDITYCTPYIYFATLDSGIVRLDERLLHAFF